MASQGAYSQCHGYREFRPLVAPFGFHSQVVCLISYVRHTVWCVVFDPHPEFQDGIIFNENAHRFLGTRSILKNDIKSVSLCTTLERPEEEMVCISHELG